MQVMIFLESNQLLFSCPNKLPITIKMQHLSSFGVLLVSNTLLKSASFPLFLFSLLRKRLTSQQGRIVSTKKGPISFSSTKKNPLSPNQKKPTIFYTTKNRWFFSICESVVRYFLFCFSGVDPRIFSLTRTSSHSF